MEKSIFSSVTHIFESTSTAVIRVFLKAFEAFFNLFF